MRDESGHVAGVFCIVSETTGRVVGERRLSLLRDLAGIAQHTSSVSDVFATAATVLGYPEDLPFALCYARVRDGGATELVGSSGLDQVSGGVGRARARRARVLAFRRGSPRFSKSRR